MQLINFFTVREGTTKKRFKTNKLTFDIGLDHQTLFVFDLYLYMEFSQFFIVTINAQKYVRTFYY